MLLYLQPLDDAEPDSLDELWIVVLMDSSMRETTITHREGAGIDALWKTNATGLSIQHHQLSTINSSQSFDFWAELRPLARKIRMMLPFLRALSERPDATSFGWNTFCPSLIFGHEC